MRLVLPLLLCSVILGGCASPPADPDGIWINQAAIDAATKQGKLREALLAYGPNLEWQVNQKTGEAHYSNGFELSEGRLTALEQSNWRVDFYGDYHETLTMEGKELVQQASENLPEQRFVHPATLPAQGAPSGSAFEQALYAAYLGGTWKIAEGQGRGGLVKFNPDGTLEGLPGADRYALCLAGDCAAMSGENDSIWLQQGNRGATWLFVHDGDKMEILAARNRARIDEMPEYFPGKRAWLLERN